MIGPCHKLQRNSHERKNVYSLKFSAETEGGNILYSQESLSH